MGGQADQRHHAEHRQARYQHENHEEGQAGHGQTEEGRSLDEREESGAQSLTRPALSAVCLHHHPCTHDASTSLVATPQSARHDTAVAVGLSTQERCT